MDLEIQVIKSHGTFEEVLVADLPPNTKILGSKFVFKTKTKDGILDKYKARLGVHGHRQIPIIHFNPMSGDIFPGSGNSNSQVDAHSLAMAATQG